MVIDRYGDYRVIFDADRDQVPAFTALGQWAGLADNPDAITTPIDIAGADKSSSLVMQHSSIREGFRRVDPVGGLSYV
ncbi:hypothetical protein [Streptomyces prasinus]|uniref:hypothetical protein n=1 Tax=Streptomyces prasinus TaxID=67345 RepID=UPI0033B31B5E